MFKRMFWLFVGAGFGFGMSFWIMRTVRETVERYSPQRLSSDLTDAARAMGVDVREAVAEGRAVMRQREAELHAERRARQSSPETRARLHPG